MIHYLPSSLPPLFAKKTVLKIQRSIFTMEKDHVQKYSPLLDVCDACGRAQAGPRRLRYFTLVAKSLCLLILVLVAVALFRVVINPPTKSSRPQQPSDLLFGDSKSERVLRIPLQRCWPKIIVVPWRNVVLENDQRYIDDPFTDIMLPWYNDSLLWKNINPGKHVVLSIELCFSHKQEPLLLSMILH